jgi:hypothetical protein
MVACAVKVGLGVAEGTGVVVADGTESVVGVPTTGISVPAPMVVSSPIDRAASSEGVEMGMEATSSPAAASWLNGFGEMILET